MIRGHICTCDDCHPAPYTDNCKYEAVARQLADALEREVKARLSGLTPNDAVTNDAIKAAEAWGLVGRKR